MNETARKRAKVRAGDWLAPALERGKTEVFSTIATITPADAERLLANNADNRHLNATTLRQLTADLKAGRFVFNGESVIVADTGELNDGQHRLTASVETGLPLPSVVVFGVPRASRATLDMGRNRCAGDFLAIHGLPYAMTTAAIARLVLAWERGNGRNFEASRWLTIPEQTERGLNDAAIHAAAKWAVNHNAFAHRLAPASAIGFCHVVFSRLSPTAAEEYLLAVIMGEGLKRTDAAFAVRDALTLRDKRSGGDRAARLSILVNGWNAYRRNRTPGRAELAGNYPLPDLV